MPDTGEVAATRAQWTAGTNEQELLNSEAANGNRTVRLLSHQETAAILQSPASAEEEVSAEFDDHQPSWDLGTPTNRSRTDLSPHRIKTRSY